MKPTTRLAFITLTKGLNDLLACLTAEQALQIDYTKIQLEKALRGLREALDAEKEEA